MKTPTTLRGKLLEAKPPELTELEHRRARAKLLGAAAEEMGRRPAGSWVVFAGVVAATAALVVVNAHRRPMTIVAVAVTAEPAPAPSAAISTIPVVDTKPVTREAIESPPPVRPARTKTTTPGPSFEKAFADFERGNYGVSDLELEAFLHAFPNDPRAEDAAYLRAVARYRLGDREGAAVLARSYLDDYPNGLRRPEAERITH